VDEDTSAAVDGGMEATIFTAWIYDHLLPHAAAVPPTRHLVKVGWLPGKNAGTSTGQETGRSDQALLSDGRTRLTEGQNRHATATLLRKEAWTDLSVSGDLAVGYHPPIRLPLQIAVKIRPYF